MILPPPHELIPGLLHDAPACGGPSREDAPYCHPARPATLTRLGLPPTVWNPHDPEWTLPDGWQDTLYAGLRTRLDAHRSLRLFLDGCVRCGACADKCPVFLGTRDPRNMPVLRAELLRAVYRRNFTLAGRLLGAVGLGEVVGAQSLDTDTVRAWFTYFYQCTQCRRCAVFCPCGIDTAEITLHVRDMLLELGLGTHQILASVVNCLDTGNHLGIRPPVFHDIVDMLCDDIAAVTGLHLSPPIDEPGHEVLFVMPSGDLFAEPGIYTFMGYLLLFHAVGLDYTLSTVASEGGNFASFVSPALARQLCAPLYVAADQLKVRWLLGGECGHMWRVIAQYMDTFTGSPPSGLRTPVSPVTGTIFDRAAHTKVLHIAEFTADLVRNNALRLAPSRNDHLVVTWHDSCNPARALGMFDEPRTVLHAVCHHVEEMPRTTIRESTFCCGSGSGLNTDELFPWRMQAGFARGQALRFVRDHQGVNHMACMCALDRVTLPPLAGYWAPGVSVGGLHELVGNALVLDGEMSRSLDLRRNPLPPTPEPQA